MDVFIVETLRRVLSLQGNRETACQRQRDCKVFKVFVALKVAFDDCPVFVQSCSLCVVLVYAGKSGWEAPSLYLVAS